MRRELFTLCSLLILGLTAPVWADPGMQRPGQDGTARLDNLSAQTPMPCCPTEGTPANPATAAQTGQAPGQAMAARKDVTAPCRNPQGGPCKERVAEGCPCPCMHGDPGKTPCHAASGGHGKCEHAEGMGGRDRGCRHDSEMDRGDPDLRARLHHLERRLDMLQSVLESMLERQGSRHCDGPRPCH